MLSRSKRGIRLVAWAAGLTAVLAVIAVVTDIESRGLDEAERSRLGGTYVRLAHGLTHYKLSGPQDGPVVVLVHGGTIPIWTWDRQVPALTAAGYRVLTYDAYGRGYSDRPEVVYDRHLYEGQLLELVDTLGIRAPFDLVGLSLGGGTVISFTANHPERVRRLALIAPVVRDFAVPRLFQVPVVGDFAARTFGMRVLARRSRSLFAGSADEERYMGLMNEQVRYKGFRASALSMLRNDALGDFTKEYRAVGRQARSVLLIWGTADAEITKPMIDTARAAIPSLLFRPVPDIGHGVVFQRPDLINRHLLEFLAPDTAASR